MSDLERAVGHLQGEVTKLKNLAKVHQEFHQTQTKINQDLLRRIQFLESSK